MELETGSEGFAVCVCVGKVSVWNKATFKIISNMMEEMMMKMKMKPHEVPPFNLISFSSSNFKLKTVFVALSRARRTRSLTSSPHPPDIGERGRHGGSVWLYSTPRGRKAT